MAEDRREEFHVGDCAKEMKEGSGRERVRCSSLIDWPVYPRVAHTMRASNGGRNPT